MCGIIGYVGNNCALKVLYNGLKKLEYRGYDSAGISYFWGKQFITTKKAGTIDSLFSIVDKNQSSNIGIGHTRWATNGKATDENSHPHIGALGKVSIVHNGIIENYLELKKQYLDGVVFKSQTDTEVISNLVEKFYEKHNDKLRAICETIKLLKGSFALAILFFDDCQSIYFAKNLSPLVIGLGKNEKFISSDILGFADNAKFYADIKDMQFGCVNSQNIKIVDTDFAEQPVIKMPVPIEKKDVAKGEFPHFMIKEINEIANAIKNITRLYSKTKNPLSSIDCMFFKNINRIRLIACGTSYHASLVGEKFLNGQGFDATSEIASEFIYNSCHLDSSTLCIFISQSGETADTLSAIKIAKQYGAKTVGITNVSTSTICSLCDHILPLNCGAEIAVASTKAYNCQICVLILLASYLENNFKISKKTIKNLLKLSDYVDIKNFEEQIKPLVKDVLKAKNIFMLGKNFDYVSSLEAALKLKEISYINCQAYASGELKHGTIALVDNETLIFSFLTEQNLIDKTLNVIEQTRARGAKICLISPFDNVLQKFENALSIKLPLITNYLYPILSIIPLQLVAYYVSIALGNNPDKPRNLAKSVTVE